MLPHIIPITLPIIHITQTGSVYTVIIDNLIKKIKIKKRNLKKIHITQTGSVYTGIIE